MSDETDIKPGQCYTAVIRGRRTKVCTVAESIMTPDLWICEGISRGQQFLVPIADLRLDETDPLEEPKLVP